MTAAIEIAQRATSQLGEGPTWDGATDRLLWVDILNREVHHLDPASGSDVVLRTSQDVGAAKPRVGGGLVLNLRDGVALTEADTAAGATLGHGDALSGTHDGGNPLGGPHGGHDGGERWLARWPREGCRGNDAAVDAAGRLWAGTMRYDEAPGGGRLYRVDADGAVVTVLDRVTISNGIGWSPDGRLMYYVDTPTRRVDVFDVDTDTGLIAGRRRPFELGVEVGGNPDGLTVDGDGCVWVALWAGGAVHRYTPDGRLDRVVELPTTHPTACTFGGPGLRDLYVTTARVALDAAALADQPLAGSVLVLPDVGTGLPTPAFAG